MIWFFRPQKKVPSAELSINKPELRSVSVQKVCVENLLSIQINTKLICWGGGGEGAAVGELLLLLRVAHEGCPKRSAQLSARFIC